MNIQKVNLLQLKNIVNSGSPLTYTDIDIINRIIFIKDDNVAEGVNVVIVYGNPISLYDRCDTGIAVLNDNPNSIIILSGGAFLPDCFETESEAMKHYCLEKGIPEKRIIIENDSMTTGENVKYCSRIIREMAFISPSIVSISSRTHIRRIKMNFAKYKGLYPTSSSFYYFNSKEQGYDSETWIYDDKARKAIATELGFIHEYLYELDYPFFEI